MNNRQSTIDFEALGFETMRPGKKIPSSESVRTRRFRSWFGTDEFVVSLVWKKLDETGWLLKAISVKPVHLLWALNFLQVYAKEEVTAALFRSIDRKTLRKWVWFFVNGVASLAKKVVSTYAFDLVFRKILILFI